MTKSDPQNERQRLRRLYGAMSDEELQKASKESSELTDWAFEAMREEMKRRGLSWAGQDMPLPSQVGHHEAIEDAGKQPVGVRRYRDMPEAFVEKSVLEGAGIQCFLEDENVVWMDWLCSNAMGGIKLVVRKKDAEEAERLLGASPAEETENTRVEQ